MSMFKFDYKQIDEREARVFANAHKRIFEGAAAVPRRSSETLLESATREFDEALEDIIFAWGDSAELVLPESSLVTANKIKNIKDSVTKEKLVKAINSHLGISLVSVLASKGALSANRFWILMSDDQYSQGEDGDPKFLYVGFPVLAADSHHGSLIHVFANSISAYLASGGPSTLIDFIEKSGKSVHASKRRYCFTKGMHVSGFPEGNHKALREDLKMVYSKMFGAKGKAVLDEFKFIDKPTIVK